MAVIYLEARDKRDSRALTPDLPDRAAISIFNNGLATWKGVHRPVFDFESLLYLTQEDMDSGKPWASLFIDFMTHDDTALKDEPVKEERKHQWWSKK